MADTTFIDKTTVITADWANDVNDVAYTDCGGVGGLSSTATGKGASLVGIEDAGGIYTSVTVEGALQEFTDPIKDKASPGAIGGTTPAAGTFTTLTANTSAVVPDGSADTHAVNVGQVQEAAVVSADAGGTADAITAAISPAPSTWVDGQTFLIRGCSNNLTTTPTFTPNSGTLVAKTLVKYSNQTLAPYDLGGDHWFRYDSVNDVCEVVNPSTKRLIAEQTVTGSAVTSIDFTNLDIDSHRSYRIELGVVNAIVGPVTLDMYVNNDTTRTNYYRKLDTVIGASFTGGTVTNDALIAYLAAERRDMVIVDLFLVGDLPKAMARHNRNTPVALEHYETTWAKSSTVTNITQITFTAQTASALDVGTTIRIYRNDI